MNTYVQVFTEEQLTEIKRVDRIIADMADKLIQALPVKDDEVFTQVRDIYVRTINASTKVPSFELIKEQQRDDLHFLSAVNVANRFAGGWIAEGTKIYRVAFYGRGYINNDLANFQQTDQKYNYAEGEVNPGIELAIKAADRMNK